MLTHRQDIGIVVVQVATPILSKGLFSISFAVERLLSINVSSELFLQRSYGSSWSALCKAWIHILHGLCCLVCRSSFMILIAVFLLQETKQTQAYLVDYRFF
jgi:hypothetical protein